MKIHKSAIVKMGADLGENVEVGPNTIIEDNVVIAEGTVIGSNILIANGTRIGKNCKVFHGAVLGTIPQDLKFGGEKTTLEIGDNTTIREYATLNRGTTDHWKTVVGSNCLLMAYIHVAHDCTIGDNVIIANAVNMAGHVTIEDNVGIGGLTAIHQFTKLGQFSFIGGGYRITKDVPPFILAMGEPLRFGGLNLIGLKRKGFGEDVLNALKESYKLIYRKNLNLKDAIIAIKREVDSFPQIKDLVSFLESSERGIIR